MWTRHLNPSDAAKFNEIWASRIIQENSALTIPQDHGNSTSTKAAAASKNKNKRKSVMIEVKGVSKTLYYDGKNNVCYYLGCIFENDNNNIMYFFCFVFRVSYQKF